MKVFTKILMIAVVIACVLSLSACLSEGGSSNDDVYGNGGNGGNSVGDANNGGSVNPATCSHTYGEWEVTNEPTCKLKGLKVRKCTKCNTEESELLDMVAHTFGEYTVKKEADCENKGERYHICTVCNTKETEYPDALGHKYGADNICSVCDDRKFGTEGLLYEIQGKNDPYPGTAKLCSIGTAISAKNIYVASEYQGQPVTLIDTDAFSDGEIESIVIPASVKAIKPSAFTRCYELKSVTFKTGSQLEILEGFQHCTSLQSIKVPANVREVAAHAFRGCTALNSVSFELTEGWYSGNTSSPRFSEPTTVTDTYRNANTLKYEANLYFFFRLVAPE